MGDRGIQIQESAVGSAIVSGDGNVVNVIYQVIQQSILETVGTATRLGPNPYRGLAAFTEKDSDRYFGREAQIDRLWKEFQTLVGRSGGPRLLTVLGPSGCGKSSLVRAGLIPALAQRPLLGKKRMRVAVMVPGEHPLEALAGVLAKAVTEDSMPVAKNREFTEEMDIPSASGEYDGLRRITALMPEIRDSPLVVLVDQFEEVYTNEPRGTTPEEQSRRERFIQERMAFIENLLCAAKDSSGNLSVILTLRSDFLGETQRHPDLNQAISHCGVIVPAMTVAELARAIAEPAKRAGHPLEDALLDRMVQDMAGQEGALPLLQFALTKLWEELSQESLRGRSPLQVYLDIGGIGGAVADRADKIFDGLKDAGNSKVDRQAIAQRIFLSLVQPGGKNNWVTRRRVRVKDLATRKITLEQVKEVIHEFSKENARLISLSTVEGEITAEVTHEALFETWQRFKDWISDRWDDIRLQQRLESAATYWDEQGRPAGLLWRSPDLDLLRTFVRTANPDLNPCCLNFFRASEQAERQQALLRGAGVGALALLAAGMTWFGLQSRRAEQLALVRQLAAQAEQMSSQPRRATSQEAGALLAVHTFQIANLSGRKLDTVNQAVRQGLDRPWPIATLSHEDMVRAVSFTLDGQRVATASSDGTARVWEASTGKVIATLSHDDEVIAVSFSPDGQRVATANSDGTARVWEASTGKVIANLSHDKKVWAVSFSPDGQRVATASSDGTARVWEASTGKIIATLSHDDVVWAVSFSPDGQRVATASSDGTARVWEASTGEAIATLSHDAAVYAVSFSPNGQRVATASDDGTARVWEASTGEAIATLPHDDRVRAVSFSPDGQWVATASVDRSARVWEASTGKIIATLPHNDELWAVSFSPDGQRVATASSDRSARVWEASTGEAIATLSHNDEVWAVNFSPDGQRVATASRDGNARVWETITGEAIATLSHDERVNAVSFSPNGQRVATASDDGTARVWETSTGEAIATLSHDAGVNAVSFSPNGQRVATASSDGTARVWEASTGEAIATLSHDDDDWVWSVSFSPDGQRVATASLGGTARVWEASTGEAIATLSHDDGVLAVSFSPDGQRVATASWDGTARVWEASTGKVIATLSHDDGVLAVSFSPDGQRVVTASLDGTARVWETSTGEAIATLSHDDEVWAVSFSPDGQRVVTASVDSSARVWEASRGAAIATLSHNAAVLAVSFSPDGQRVATASGDGTARVWEVSTGEAIATLSHDAAVRAVSFSPDGQRAATASSDGTARIRWVWSQDLVAQICQRHDRNFTATEWRNYVQRDLSQYNLTCANFPVHATVIVAAHTIARDGNGRQATALLRHLLRISRAAGHDIDLDPATEEIAQNPRAVARKYSAVHLVREATTLARNGKVARATRLFQQALDRDLEIDLNPSTDTLDQNPAAVAHTLANPTE
ncbi:AAA family ATPase [Nodosilinea sp. E11]|uniref:nSTAND1 domain-containing NTPase n=1 Tax=Nodosilinea sp. E11 TaxID=3037479 RepID=UPI0029342E7D|nr:AAA family ATPase [Nodosilinea sp. E11]WOD41900.1 AAA family ATPase [Nodosilinea sp. E11]